MLLSVSTAALSCSVDSGSGIHADQYEHSLTMVISGTASDRDSGSPLTDIKICLYASEMVTGKKDTTTVYTDERGYFIIKAEGFSRPVTCTIIAEDKTGEYEAGRQDLNISWNGTSFDEYTGYFYVNDCDFYLGKRYQILSGCPSESLHCLGEQPTIFTNCL